jgi:hypothetical protein
MATSKETTSRQGNQPTQQAIKITRPRGDGIAPPPAGPTSEPADNTDDKAALDEFERLADACILDDDDDEPGIEDEIQTLPVEKNLPKFAIFRSNPETVFEMWGANDRQGMDEMIFVTTKQFAPHFEDDVDLRRVRFFETVTTDGVPRLVYCFVPEKGTRKPNLWLTSRLAAMEMSLTQWTTMRSRKLLGQFTYRPAKKDYGEPKFSGLTKGQLVDQLRRLGLLVDSKDHPYYKRLPTPRVEPNLTHLFDRFRDIVLGDTEFVSRPGELYEPVCAGFKELRSGRSDVLWYDELGRKPPHAHDKDVLFVGFTGAEPEFYQSVGWGFDCAFLDLRVEGILQTNIALPRGDPKREKLPRSLISFLRFHGIRDGDEALKALMRQRIMQGRPFTRQERRLILKYCLSDVLLLEKLLQVLLPGITNFHQALMRGEYVKFTAEMFHRGQPADRWAEPLLRQPKVRKDLRLRAVSDTSLTHGLLDGPAIKQAQMREFIVRHKLPGWRTTPSGKLATANRDLLALETRHPEFRGIADVHKTVSQLHELQLVAGADGRYRTPLWAFSTITGRAAPGGAEFPFTTPAWCRFTLMPGPGKGLLYLDFASMEFGVAAALSRDPAMLADYATEPYLVLPILTGLLPHDANRLTHRDEREHYKAPTLSLQYGGGAALLARKLDLSRSQGQRLVDLHHERYSVYWGWSDRRLEKAFENGELVARDGWRCGITSRTSIFTARNWLIQANAAALFRYGGLLMRQLGLPVIAPVHDALLLEVVLDRLEQDKVRAIYCLERASRRLLRGFTLRVDAKTVLPGERFTDARGERAWAFVERTLHELEKEGLREEE